MEWVLTAVMVAVAAGAVATRRVASAEAVKLAAHPFVRVAAATIILGMPLYAELFIAGAEPLPESAFRRVSGFAIFGACIRFGFYAAAISAVVLGALSFAGEFDRGTIKNLLVRPVTRAELFAGKIASQLALTLLLFAVVVFEAALWSSLRGELHHVWRRDVFEVYPSYAEMMSHAQRAAGLLLMPLLASAMLGISISNLTESSAFAVALSLGTLFAFTVAGGVLGEDPRSLLFTFYPGYGIDVLEGLASGDSRAQWKESLFAGGWYALVPLATGGALALPSWLAFRGRDITA